MCLGVSDRRYALSRARGGWELGPALRVGVAFRRGGGGRGGVRVDELPGLWRDFAAGAAVLALVLLGGRRGGRRRMSSGSDRGVSLYYGLLAWSPNVFFTVLFVSSRLTSCDWEAWSLLLTNTSAFCSVGSRFCG